jgi:hypothetical protein
LITRTEQLGPFLKLFRHEITCRKEGKCPFVTLYCHVAERKVDYIVFGLIDLTLVVDFAAARFNRRPLDFNNSAIFMVLSQKDVRLVGERIDEHIKLLYKVCSSNTFVYPPLRSKDYCRLAFRKMLASAISLDALVFRSRILKNYQNWDNRVDVRAFTHHFRRSHQSCNEYVYNLNVPDETTDHRYSCEHHYMWQRGTQLLYAAIECGLDDLPKYGQAFGLTAEEREKYVSIYPNFAFGFDLCRAESFSQEELRLNMELPDLS